MLPIRTPIKKNIRHYSLRKKVNGVRKTDNTQRIYSGSDELAAKNERLSHIMILLPNQVKPG